jgi:hypothetical protein
MSRIQCEQENEVREASRSGLWTPALRQHASLCAACAEASIVAEFLLHEAQIASSDARLPTSGLIWWKAQLAAENAALTRATRPITLVTVLSFLAVALGLLWLIAESVEITAASNGGAKYPAYLQHLLHLYANSAALMMTTGVLACLLLGSLYLVWRE